MSFPSFLGSSPPNIFEMTNSRMDIPTDVLFARLAMVRPLYPLDESLRDKITTKMCVLQFSRFYSACVPLRFLHSLHRPSMTMKSDYLNEQNTATVSPLWTGHPSQLPLLPSNIAEQLPALPSPYECPPPSPDTSHASRPRDVAPRLWRFHQDLSHHTYFVRSRSRDVGYLPRKHLRHVLTAPRCNNHVDRESLGDILDGSDPTPTLALSVRHPSSRCHLHLCYEPPTFSLPAFGDSYFGEAKETAGRADGAERGSLTIITHQAARRRSDEECSRARCGERIRYRWTQGER
jgi:hypothetical protein